MRDFLIGVFIIGVLIMHWIDDSHAKLRECRAVIELLIPPGAMK